MLASRLPPERPFRGSPQNQYRQQSTFNQNQKSTYPPNAVKEQNSSMTQMFPRKELLNGKGSEQMANI
jgi:hypothetical protein